MINVGKCSLMEEISKTEDAIKICYERISSLEDKLNESYNDDLKNELQEFRKLLRTNEELLYTLHKHNTSSFTFGVAASLIIFILWMIYMLVNGNDF